jgi:hypothetical protein
MEAIKRTVTVSADRELLIKLPENAVPDAMADPLFVADLQQVEEDFSLADLDGVEG